MHSPPLLWWLQAACTHQLLKVISNVSVELKVLERMRPILRREGRSTQATWVGSMQPAPIHCTNSWPIDAPCPPCQRRAWPLRAAGAQKTSLISNAPPVCQVRRSCSVSTRCFKCVRRAVPFLCCKLQPSTDAWKCEAIMQVCFGQHRLQSFVTRCSCAQTKILQLLYHRPALRLLQFLQLSCRHARHGCRH